MTLRKVSNSSAVTMDRPSHGNKPQLDWTTSTDLPDPVRKDLICQVFARLESSLPLNPQTHKLAGALKNFALQEPVPISNPSETEKSYSVTVADLTFELPRHD